MLINVWRSIKSLKRLNLFQSSQIYMFLFNTFFVCCQKKYVEKFWLGHKRRKYKQTNKQTKKRKKHPSFNLLYAYSGSYNRNKPDGWYWTRMTDRRTINFLQVETSKLDKIIWFKLEIEVIKILARIYVSFISTLGVF